MTKNESARTSAWGRIRDALAAVHNLETLLRSPRVGTSTLAALLPELLVSCAVLRDAFDPAGNDAREDLATYARERIAVLEAALQEAGTGGIETRARLALEQVVTRVLSELDAAVDLLDLSDRAHSANLGELSLGELTRAALGMAGSVPPSAEGVLVRVDTEDAACVVLAEPHVVARVLGGAIVRVRAAGVRDIVVRARCEERAVTLTVGPADVAAALLPGVTTRVMRRIPPTDAILEDAVRAIGGRLSTGERSVVLSLPVVR
jgi:hypothetical protein